MTTHKTPTWLKDIQNKSWEPEILISGITLTFIFLLSNQIYNFCALLIQKYGVFDSIANSFYIISIFILTGLKITLIIHLIFRGIWAGFVGLSYVFPKGINKRKLPKSKRSTQYNKPETFVIKFENICSLLFSFVFASIASVFAAIIGLSPLVLLFIFDINTAIARYIANYYAIFLFFGAIIIAILINTKFKDSKFRKFLDNSIFEYTQKIYSTNLGKAKTYFLFTAFSLLIVLFSYQDIFLKFNFRNDKPSGISSSDQPISLHKDNYESFRNPKLRIPKATIGHFYNSDNDVRLFISHFKADEFTVKKINQNLSQKKLDSVLFTSDKIDLTGLYQLYLDDNKISDINWFSIQHQDTDQNGLITSLNIEEINQGIHRLHVHKWVWNVKKDSLQYIKNWEIIPFIKK